MTDKTQDHWLVRKSSIRIMWIGGIVLLVLTLLAEFLIPTKGYFGLDDWPGFGAAFGFFTCLLMVVFAKLLGFFLKRREGYYAERDDV